MNKTERGNKVYQEGSGTDVFQETTGRAAASQSQPRLSLSVNKLGPVFYCGRRGEGGGTLTSSSGPGHTPEQCGRTGSPCQRQGPR